MISEDDASTTFRDDSSMCRKKQATNQPGAEHANDVVEMEEASQSSIREEDDASVGNDNESDRAIHDDQNQESVHDDMPKQEGPITTMTTSDAHRWEFASHDNNHNNNNDDHPHRLASSTEFKSSSSPLESVRDDETCREKSASVSRPQDAKTTSFVEGASVSQDAAATMYTSIRNTSSHNDNGDAVATEEATSSMLHLSNNARPKTLPPNHVGLDAQALSDANRQYCASSSDMEVDTTVNMNVAQHSDAHHPSAMSQGATLHAARPSIGNGHTLKAVESCTASFPMRDSRRLSSSSLSIHHRHHHHHSATRDTDHERRGSGFLLLAAEAMERTESRENAIRRAAMELVAAAANGAASASGSGESAETNHSIFNSHGSNVAAASTAMCQYSARLQQVFEMPSLHADQLLSSVNGHRSRRRSCSDGRTSVTMSMSIGTTENIVSRQDESTRTIQSRQWMTGNLLASQDASSSDSRLSALNHAPVLSAPLIQSTYDATPPNHKASSDKSKTSKSDRNDTAAAAASSTTPQLLPSGRPRPPPQKHVYHDYANLPDAAPILTISKTAATADYHDQSTPSPAMRKKTGGVSQPFPEKLMSMLDNETHRRPEVVSWLPHGRAFLVRKPKVFTSEIMPEYFRQSKLTSFQRQLNLYGFRRITQGADGGAYYHELFLRGRPNLCARMVRQKVKGTGHKQPTDIASEPNFYAMPSVEPLPEAVASYSSIMQQEQPPMTEEDDQIYDSYMNSPGIRAAALLKRMSSVGTPSQFSLDDYTNNIHPPPLVSSGTGAIDRSRSDGFRPSNFDSSNLYNFDSFQSENSTSYAYSPFVTLESRTGRNDEIMEVNPGKTEEVGSTEAAAENNSFLTEV